MRSGCRIAAVSNTKDITAFLSATLCIGRAVVEEGIVPGRRRGSAARVKALEDLKLGGDEQIGVDIIRRACEEPIRQIVGNAGLEGTIVIGKIRNNNNANYGFNAATEQYEDLVTAGVIDPAKVTRSALQNAASTAGLMLTTEAMVCDIPAKKAAPAPVGHGPEGMDY
jgi:chaperonin GroEL